MKDRVVGAALITGASSGLGAAFARQLASLGYALILVARREDRLRGLALEIGRSRDVDAEVLVADLSGPMGIDRVEKRIAERDDLELLVNNAGFGILGRFNEVEFGKQLDMINVHVIASLRLVRKVLPGMLARGRGAIINVSSVAAFVPTPGNVTYSATKACMAVFSEALAVELKGSGVKVQVLCPGFTVTEFHDTPEYQSIDLKSKVPKALWMSADEVVAASLRALTRGKLFCVPGFHNRLIVALGRSGLASLLLRMFLI